MKDKKEGKNSIDFPLGVCDSNSPLKKKANDAGVENIGGKESKNNSYSMNKWRHSTDGEATVSMCMIQHVFCYIQYTYNSSYKINLFSL